MHKCEVTEGLLCIYSLSIESYKSITQEDLFSCRGLYMIDVILGLKRIRNFC